MTVFDADIHYAHIFLVGCGGTGSSMARHLARMLFDMKERSLQMPESITFIDPDHIEARNIGRQMFSPGEIGKNKADVLASRFNRVLGLDIKHIAEPFHKDHLGPNYRINIVLGAVDNWQARKAIADANPDIWIDAGNKVSAGQVVIGTTRSQSVLDRVVMDLKSDKHKDIDDAKIDELPNAAYLFPELLEPVADEPDTTISCAELMLTGDQDILINDMMANIMAQYLKKLLYRQPIGTFCTFVDSDLIAMRSLSVDLETLSYYIQKEEVA